MTQSIRRPGDSLHIKPLGKTTIPVKEVYTINEEINSGAFGVVCKTYHVSNPNEAYAVKVVSRHDANNDKEAFHEVTMLLCLKMVPNIVRLIDFYIEIDNIYIFQSLATGGDLLDRLTEKTTYKEIEAIELSKNILRALQSLRRHNVVHRDIKAENLLVKNHEDDVTVWLCDFGDSKILLDNGVGLRTMCGTPSYVAPEVVEGIGYRHEVDMWSFGCLIHLVLGGYLPFGDPDEDAGGIFQRSTTCDYDFDCDEIWNTISQEAKDLIDNCLKLDVHQRYTATQALSSDWLKNLDDSPKRRSKYKNIDENHIGENDNDNDNDVTRVCLNENLEEHIQSTNYQEPTSEDPTSATADITITDFEENSTNENDSVRDIKRYASMPDISEEIKTSLREHDVVTEMDADQLTENWSRKKKMGHQTQINWSMGGREMHWIRQPSIYTINRNKRSNPITTNQRNKANLNEKKVRHRKSNNRKKKKSSKNKKEIKKSKTEKKASKSNNMDDSCANKKTGKKGCGKKETSDDREEL